MLRYFINGLVDGMCYIVPKRMQYKIDSTSKGTTVSNSSCHYIT